MSIESLLDTMDDKSKDEITKAAEEFVGQLRGMLPPAMLNATLRKARAMALEFAVLGYTLGHQQGYEESRMVI